MTETVTRLTGARWNLINEGDRKAVSADMEAVLARARLLHLPAIAKLNELKLENEEYDAQNPHQKWDTGQLRRNIHQMIGVPFSAALTDFRLAADAYSCAVHEEQRQKLHRAGVLDEKKIERIVETGQTQQVLNRLISEDVSDVLDELEQRHDAILDLERNVRETQTAFQDLAHVVNLQQVSVDTIERHVHNAQDYVDRGATNLDKGEQDDKTNRKCMCAILSVIITVLVVVLLPTLLKIL
jgi:syntaxin 1B/2/3